MHAQAAGLWYGYSTLAIDLKAEEHKLVQNFGLEYVDYRKKTLSGLWFVHGFPNVEKFCVYCRKPFFVKDPSSVVGNARNCGKPSCIGKPE